MGVAYSSANTDPNVESWPLDLFSMMLPQSWPLGPQGPPPFCLDPLSAVMETLACIEAEDAECASKGYASTFKKFHNGIEDESAAGLDTPIYWGNAFFVVDLALDYNFVDTVDVNQISLRYVESVKTLDVSKYTLENTTKAGPESVTLYQHEHALVTVNDDCQMVQWDQYGDNKEQADVNVFVGATLPYLDQYGACLQKGVVDC